MALSGHNTWGIHPISSFQKRQLDAYCHRLITALYACIQSATDGNKITMPLNYLSRVLCSLRAFLVNIDAIVIVLFSFFIFVFLTDNDQPSRSIDIIVYIGLGIGIFTIPADRLLGIIKTPVFLLSFVFILQHLLTPVWTGGMQMDRWLETARLAFLGLGGAVLVGSAVGTRRNLLRWFPLLAACAAISVSAFSIGRFVINAGLQEIAVRLITFPWPNPNTGSALLGLVLTAVAFVPLKSLIPGSAEHPLPRGTYWLGQGTNSILCMILMVCLVVFSLADILLSGTRSVLFSIFVVIMFYVFIKFIKNDNRQNIINRNGAIAIIFIGFILFIIIGNKIVLFRDFGQRDEVWSGFWAIARETFWLGRGIQNEYQFTVSGVSAPHNQLLTSLLYGGVGSAILYFAIYAQMFFFGIKYYDRKGSFSVAAIAIYLIVHGMFETVIIASYPGWRWIYVWAPIGLAAGIEARLRSAPVSTNGTDCRL